MAKRSLYYVLVLTKNGQGKFVTSLDYSTKSAHWSLDEKPLAMSKTVAEDISFGLCLNFYPAVVVKSHFEIQSHWFYTITDGGEDDE